MVMITTQFVCKTRVQRRGFSSHFTSNAKAGGFPKLRGLLVRYGCGNVLRSVREHTRGSQWKFSAYFGHFLRKSDQASAYCM